MTPPLELTSSRLIIRQATVDYTPAIIDYYSRNETFLKPYEPKRRPEFYTKKYWHDILKIETSVDFEQTMLRLLIFEVNDTNTMIGSCNFSGFIRGVFHACYLGYSLDELNQGNGYMTEALQTAIAYLFETRNLHRIMANCLLTNTRSLTVLKTLGFQQEGIAKEYLCINGKWEDHIMTALINSLWKPE